jgi:carbonic anhydrase
MGSREGNLPYQGATPASSRVACRLFERPRKATEEKDNADMLSLQRSGEDTKRDCDPNLNLLRANFLQWLLHALPGKLPSNCNGCRASAFKEVVDHGSPRRVWKGDQSEMISGVAIGIAAQAGIELGVPTMLEAQTNLTPDAALKELMAGNERFAANQLTSVEHDLEILKEHTADKQEPFAAVLTCADSRVPVELIFDQTIGHIFVARVAGNMVTPEIIATLEYGVAVLGVKVLLVLGHTSCGAVKAAMKSDTVPGQISVLYKYLRPAVEKSGGNLDQAIGLNAGHQAELLRTSSTVVRDALKGGKVKVVSGVYDLASGKVRVK